MSRTARPRSRCSRRSAPSRRTSRTRRLLVAAEGKLSKRLGSYGAEHLRAEGVEPMALLSVLARIGTSQPVEPVASLDELAESFDFSTFGRAPAHFDPHEVELINARLLHKLDYAAVADRLPGRSDRAGLAAAPRPTSSGWPISPAGSPCFTARSSRPSSAMTSGCWSRMRPASPRSSTGAAEPWRALTERAQADDRQEGPRAVPSAAPRADGPRERAGNGRPRRRHGPGPGRPPPRGRRSPLIFRSTFRQQNLFS